MKTFAVSRQQPATFEERCVAAKQAAECWKASSVVDGIYDGVADDLE